MARKVLHVELGISENHTMENARNIGMEDLVSELFERAGLTGLYILHPMQNKTGSAATKGIKVTGFNENSVFIYVQPGGNETRWRCRVVFGVNAPKYFELLKEAERVGNEPTKHEYLVARAREDTVALILGMEHLDGEHVSKVIASLKLEFELKFYTDDEIRHNILDWLIRECFITISIGDKKVRLTRKAKRLINQDRHGISRRVKQLEDIVKEEQVLRHKLKSIGEDRATLLAMLKELDEREDDVKTELAHPKFPIAHERLDFIKDALPEQQTAPVAV